MNENEKKTDAGAEAPVGKKPEKTAKPLTGRARTIRRGTIAATAVAVIVALVVVLNLIVGQLPSNVRQIDISDKRIYTVSDTAKDYLSKLDKDVEIILISEKGATLSLTNGTDAIDLTSKYLTRFASCSSHLKFTTVDPLKYASVLEQYSCQTNTVVVKCGDKFKTISLFGYDGYTSGIILLNYQYASQGYNYADSFDADGQLVSAIDYVTGDSFGTAYLLTGHGEGSVTSGISDAISKMNITSSSEDVNLLMSAAVPDDCDLLICYAPTTDLTSEEATLLSNYMQAGGNFLLIIDKTSLTNFNNLLAEYGLQMQSGKIGDTGRVYKQFYNQYGAFCIAPVLSQTSSITAGLTANAMLRNSSGMLQVTPARDTITVDAFMTTSENGVCYVSDSNSTTGTYVIGAVATEASASDSTKTSHFTVISSTSLADETITQYGSSFSNVSILTNALAQNFSSVTSVSIPARSLEISYNVISSYKFWSILFIAVIPLLCIVGGLVYWTRRRKR